MDGTEHMQNAARVTLSGEMTIYNAAQIKATLAEAMRDAADRGRSVGHHRYRYRRPAADADRQAPSRLPRASVNHSPEVLRLIDLANLGGALGDPLFIAANLA